MSLIRRIPLKWRLPLIHGGLETLSLLRGHRSHGFDAPRTPGPLVVSGFFAEALGVGRAGALTAQALEAAGLPAIRHDLRPDFARLLDGRATYPSLKPGGVWLQHANAPEGIVADLALGPQRGRYRIGYWAWETSVAPAQWARQVPKYHEIWVPSVFCAESLRASLHNNCLGDLSGRIRVMPHPLPEPQPVAPDPERFGLKASAVRALCLFDARSAFARKNPWAAIETWCTAMPNSRPNRAQLLVKCLAGDVATREGGRLRALIARRPDIVLLTDRLSDAEMDVLVESVDFVISLHRAEGFGLSLAEAMLRGKAVVATEWSGNLDFMTLENSALVPVTVVPVSDPSGTYRSGQWAKPNLGIAVGEIRVLLENPARRAMLGAEARKIGPRLRAPWSAESLKALPFSTWLQQD